MLLLYAFVFILGLAAGSFINKGIYSIPNGGAASSAEAPAYAGCGGRPGLPGLLSPRHLMVELLTAAVFLALFAKYGLTVSFFAFAYLMSVLIAVFFIDMDRRIIPNELVVVGLAGGAALFAYNIFRPAADIYGDGRGWTPLAGLLSGSGLLYLIALLGGLIFGTDSAIGMGDVKLMAPVGLFLGWKLCLEALFISVVLSGMAGLLLVLSRRKKKSDSIPLGPFIAAGTFTAVMWGWDILNWYTGL